MTKDLECKPKWNIGAWKHYNSFDEDCGCDLCDQYSTWLYQERHKN